MARLLLALIVLVSTAAVAQGAAPSPIPADKQCRTLGSPTTPYAFPAGETLEYALDAMGAEAGTLTVRVLPRRDGSIPIEVKTQTNTFFSKVRRVKATAMSYLNAKTLRPRRYVEDAVENEIVRYADVNFTPARRQARLEFKNGRYAGKKTFTTPVDALDPAGAIFLLRQLPLKQDMTLCFDAYGIRSMWRVSGKVVGKERVSLKVGEFEAWHLQGEAVRIDNPRWRREIHLWVSADERRLPLAAVGVIDLGAVRATLTSYARPDGKKKADGKESLKW